MHIIFPNAAIARVGRELGASLIALVQMGDYRNLKLISDISIRVDYRIGTVGATYRCCLTIERKLTHSRWATFMKE